MSKILRGKNGVVLAFLLLPSLAWADAMPDQECLDCHQKATTFVQFRDGTRLKIKIDNEKYYREDIHAKEMKCGECHVGYTENRHPQVRNLKSHKDYQMHRYTLCKNCHRDQYENHSNSMHAEMIAQGNMKAPACTDCHKVHEMHSMKNSKKQVVTTCGDCHEKVYATYKESVHGLALLDHDNPDVPSCVDCHAAHENKDPRTAEAHIYSPDLCRECHSKKEVMQKYGLRWDVYETYLSDFHGMSVRFYQETGHMGKRVEAVCYDCHGFHDIRSPNSVKGAVDPEYVGKMCRKCHEDVPDDFQLAWLSHYKPTLTKFPLVFLAKVFYWFFIPFTLLGLLMHMAIHFRKYASIRWGRKND